MISNEQCDHDQNYSESRVKAQPSSCPLRVTVCQREIFYNLCYPVNNTELGTIYEEYVVSPTPPGEGPQRELLWYLSGDIDRCYVVLELGENNFKPHP